MTESSRAVIGHTSIEALRTTNMRFIPHLYAEPNPVTGKTMWGLAFKEFEMVRNGYACPECLLDFEGIVRMVCPVCGHTLDTSADFAAEPAHWKPDPNDPYRAS